MPSRLDREIGEVVELNRRLEEVTLPQAVVDASYQRAEKALLKANPGFSEDNWQGQLYLGMLRREPEQLGWKIETGEIIGVLRSLPPEVAEWSETRRSERSRSELSSELADGWRRVTTTEEAEVVALRVQQRGLSEGHGGEESIRTPKEDIFAGEGRHVGLSDGLRGDYLSESKAFGNEVGHHFGMYEDAGEAFQAHADRVGYHQGLADLLRKPEQFGALKGAREDALLKLKRLAAGGGWQGAELMRVGAGVQEGLRVVNERAVRLADRLRAAASRDAVARRVVDIKPLLKEVRAKAETLSEAVSKGFVRESVAKQRIGLDLNSKGFDEVRSQLRAKPEAYGALKSPGWVEDLVGQNRRWKEGQEAFLALRGGRRLVKEEERLTQLVRALGEKGPVERVAVLRSEVRKLGGMLNGKELSSLKAGALKRAARRSARKIRRMSRFFSRDSLANYLLPGHLKVVYQSISLVKRQAVAQSQ